MEEEIHRQIVGKKLGKPMMADIFSVSLARWHESFICFCEMMFLDLTNVLFEILTEVSE